MKRFFSILIAVAVSSLLLISCGSSKKGANCNAYGSIDQVNEDLAKK